MRLITVAASRGARWVFGGWHVFGRKPLAFTGLFAFFLFAVLVSLLLPWVGPFVMLGLLPLATLGFMIATREAMAGRVPTPGVFVLPLRVDKARRMSLVQLGLIYAVGTLLVMLASDAVDGGRFAELQQIFGSDRAEDIARVEALLADDRLIAGMLLRLGLTSLLAVPFWHAPALVHWAGQGAAQSLFSSTVAVWRNRGAFVVYLLVWTLLIIGFGLAVGLLGSVFGARQLVALIAFPAGLVFTTVFYTSLYFSFADSFGDDSAPAPA
jgi:hypothetical protein